MKIVIDLPRRTYERILNNEYDYGDINFIIQNGIPLDNSIDYATIINGICDYMTIKANYKEKINKRGICNHETIGFVQGIRWSVSCIKNNLHYIEEVMKNENK